MTVWWQDESEGDDFDPGDDDDDDEEEDEEDEEEKELEDATNKGNYCGCRNCVAWRYPGTWSGGLLGTLVLSGHLDTFDTHWVLPG